MSNSTAAQQDTGNSTDLQIGFITAQLSSLPIGVRAILTLLCVAIGVALCTVSPYAARWGTSWGAGHHKTATAEDKDGVDRKNFRLAGGVLGVITGGLGASEWEGERKTLHYLLLFRGN